VFCHSMDRLARNLDDLRRIVLSLTERGIHIVLVKENLSFTGADSPMSNLLLSVLGAIAAFEREFLARGDCGCEAGREVQRQKAVTDSRAGGRVAKAGCRSRLEGCACS
jgi:DNA invertase Pin-like site-specific DNA recombinase